MEKQEFKPSKGLTMALPYDTNEKLEKFIKKHERVTGQKLSKPKAIILIINNLIF